MGDFRKIKSQRGFFYPLLFVPTLVFIALAFAGWSVYKRSHQAEQQKIDSSSPAQKETPQKTSGSQKPKSALSPAGASAQPPAAKTSPPDKPSGRYLSIPEWGIKMKYWDSKPGGYKLNYKIIDKVTLYLSSNELDSFASSHPACSGAKKSTILNRIRPDGYDAYSGQQWSESRLKSVDAVKVNGYYYVEFFYDVCSTTSQGVSFDIQQEFGELRSKIPFNDSVSAG